MIKKVVFCLISIVSIVSLSATENVQNIYEEQSVITPIGNFPENDFQSEEDYNSLNLSHNIFKPTIANHFTAIGEAQGSNIILMGINRYIRKVSYAYISWDSIYKNLTNPWVWDQDEFWVNHLGHPYQGSFYYAAARSNNLPIWEAALITMSGSLAWELFAETETPSYNDLIVTTIGGFTIGEMLHRLYFEAAGINKLLGFFISPMNSINNAMWKGKINRPDGNVTSLNTKLFFGALVDKIFFKESFVEGSPDFIPLYLGGGINIIYGDHFENPSMTPFDQFDLDVKFSFAKNYYNVSIFSDGMIFSFTPWDQDKLKTTVGMSLHYDFLYSNKTNYSANSIGFTAKQKVLLPKEWTIYWDAHLNYIMMSASDFYFLFNDVIDPETQLENRIYDLGTGIGAKLSFNLSNPIFGNLNLFYFLDWVNTINSSVPQKGSPGSALIGIGSLNYDHKIYKTLSLGIEFSSYIKSAFYENIEDTYEYDNYINIYLKNKFK